ncbi:MAG: (2Fe-2S)-binding protein [Desulfitobacteriaceae bacterium]
MKKVINLTVNAKEYELAISPNKTLLEVLREDLGFTETKRGCDQGECGACTVLIDGRPVSSCMVLAVSAQGKNILTVEALASEGRLHPLQESFIKHGAIQCGFCTPGMLLVAKALLERNSHPDRDEIEQAIAGNICRCTGYIKIIEAIEAVVQENLEG